MDYQSRVFASVFSVPSLSHTTPTPIATPDPGHVAPGSSFGSPSTGAASGQHRAVKRNLAWSTATRFLSLPKPGNIASTSFEPLRNQRTRELEEALAYLLSEEERTHDDLEESLVDWYTNEARLHFANYVRPALEERWNEPVPLDQAWELLEETQKALEQMQNLYTQPFNEHIVPFIHNANDAASTIRPLQTAQADKDVVVAKFRREIHATFAHCLPLQRYSKTLAYVLYDAGCRIFRVLVRQDDVAEVTKEDSDAARQRMIKLLRGLQRVGLGGDQAQKAFAHSMDKLMDTFIASTYLKVDWFSKVSVVLSLRGWVRDAFCPLVELVMECLQCGPSEVVPAEMQQWQDMALGRLGRARVENLFDFVINWDDSLGAILDVKEYLKVSGAKQHLTSSFSQQVSRRLLHPGATTTYILSVYISVIRVFHELEPKGVLLERVARPIRRYLKEREDTARIIISSLLADLEDEAGNKFGPTGELSYEITAEMQKPFTNFFQEGDEELNWSDMNWQPLPTDASPDYKKSKIEDVVWFLLTLWDRDDFINELKNILGDHLLRCQDPEYEKEIRLLELIKIRLGDDKLQACEVMLRDVLDSKRINASIRGGGPILSTPNNQNLQGPDGPPRGPRTPPPRRPIAPENSLFGPSTPTLRPPQETKLNAQILSSFFWPLLRDDEFRVPAEVQTLQKEYESRFERIKGMRKLRWMNALGEGSITLSFEDRTEDFDKVTPWQVSVVYAFQPQPGEEWVANNGKGKGRPKNSSITRNVQQLEEMLEMEEQLVRQALSFWVGKSVLRETQTDTFEVIERASSSNEDADAAAAAQELAEVQAQEQAGAVRSQADLLQEKKDVYSKFIVGMLTAQGNLPVQRILMMMRIMVQGGFPFGAEEVKSLLEEMVRENLVVSLGGDIYGVRK